MLFLVHMSAANGADLRILFESTTKDRVLPVPQVHLLLLILLVLTVLFPIQIERQALARFYSYCLKWGSQQLCEENHHCLARFYSYCLKWGSQQELWHSEENQPLFEPPAVF